MSEAESERPDIKTRFKPGNRFWALRSSAGRNPKFSSPEMLWEKCQEYFQAVEDNPIMEAKAFSFQGESWIEFIPRMQIMTINGLCVFLQITKETWNQYSKDPVFSDLCELVDTLIREQKLSGAAAGQFNPMIVARDLGLREATLIDHSSSDGTMTPTTITRTIVHTDGSREDI